MERKLFIFTLIQPDLFSKNWQRISLKNYKSYHHSLTDSNRNCNTLAIKMTKFLMNFPFWKFYSVNFQLKRKTGIFLLLKKLLSKKISFVVCLWPQREKKSTNCFKQWLRHSWFRYRNISVSSYETLTPKKRKKIICSVKSVYQSILSVSICMFIYNSKWQYVHVICNG